MARSPGEMQVNCRHCGGPNQVEPQPGGETTVVCAHCRRPFTVSNEPVLGRVSLRKMPAEPDAETDFSDLLGELGDLGADLGPPPGDLGPPPAGLGPPPAGLGPPPGETGGLGALDQLGLEGETDFGGLLDELDAAAPSADASYDLEALLGGAAPDVAAPTAPLPPTQFQFGTPDQPAGLGGGPRSLADALGQPEAPDGRDGPTKLVDIDDAPAPTAGPGWRVRSERGLVYELMTVDAVVAWLEGKSDVAGVRVAEGDGAFQPVAAFPELARRLGLSVDRAFSLTGDGGDGGFALALDDKRDQRAPETQGRRPDAAGEADPLARQRVRERQAQGGESKQRAAPSRAQRPRGFATVLAVLFGACLLVAGATIAGVKGGFMERPSPPERPVPLLPPPSEDLEKAIADYDAGRFAAAAKALERLARREDDPRIHRYLALSYRRTNRKQMARAALAEYRRGMHRVSREHGRQMRKVRD